MAAVPDTPQDGRNSRPSRPPPATSSQAQTEEPVGPVSLACTYVLAGEQRMLARLAIVGASGETLLGRFVIPKDVVTDYRHEVTALSFADLYGHDSDAGEFDDVRAEVASLLEGRVLVGYASWYSLELLRLNHPLHAVRDLALYYPIQPDLVRSPSEVVSLEALVNQVREEARVSEVQSLEMIRAHGIQDPFEDAQAQMGLYILHADAWEQAIQAGEWPCAPVPAAYSNYYQ